MRSTVIGAILCVVMAASSPAHAIQILAAGTGYGGPNQTTGVCYLFNAGSTPITVTSVTFYDEIANPYDDPVADNCTGILKAHASCRVVVTLSKFEASSCVALLSSKANIRGSLEFRDDTGAVVGSRVMQ